MQKFLQVPVQAQTIFYTNEIPHLPDNGGLHYSEILHAPAPVAGLDCGTGTSGFGMYNYTVRETRRYSASDCFVLIFDLTISFNYTLKYYTVSL